ncbi:hypothetical protein ACWC4J_33395, partial [Streptomyces sp. NPDC001356]
MGATDTTDHDTCADSVLAVIFTGREEPRRRQTGVLDRAISFLATGSRSPRPRCLDEDRQEMLRA